MTCNLYCIRFDAPVQPIAKIGVTRDLRSRLGGITAVAPFPATLAKLFAFPDMDAAKCHESRILRLANRYREHGEWVLADGRLAELLGEVRGGEDLTEHFLATYRGRVISKDRPYGAASCNAVVGITDFQRTVRLRLNDGFGVEDIAVKDGFDSALIREEVRRLRERGFFRREGAA